MYQTYTSNTTQLTHATRLRYNLHHLIKHEKHGSAQMIPPLWRGTRHVTCSALH